ncbi:hypothetical protein, partial [Sinorhizobium meliloti]|uniref:hypothetical protein n=1 Tax=Rhizobium meliloti TaxID=382 RepID=UPI001AECA67C
NPSYLAGRHLEPGFDGEGGNPAHPGARCGTSLLGLGSSREVGQNQLASHLTSWVEETIEQTLTFFRLPRPVAYTPSTFIRFLVRVKVLG